jgi:hypothetical protein
MLSSTSSSSSSTTTTPLGPCGLFQFRITFEIINQFRHLVGLLGLVQYCVYLRKLNSIIVR